jgi:GAF domain-containing protein
LATIISVSEATEVAAQTLRQITPATTFAVYVYDSDSDVLICRGTFGDPMKMLDRLAIPLGERVTGWCGANLSSAMNSDASLDIAQIADSFSPPLRSAISTPLTRGERLVGVLTGYSPQTDVFGNQHLYSFEHVGTTLAAILDRRESAGSTVTPFRRVRK